MTDSDFRLSARDFVDEPAVCSAMLTVGTNETDIDRISHRPSFLDQLEGYDAHHAQDALASDVVSGLRSEHIIPLDRLSQGPVVTN